ncbi:MULTISPECIES: helix-turn-helix domain-containing protein [Prevotella]|uniref:Transcriptional regulator n=1 Tax=Prevotella herbatica TaxID=2801997 RepID=A0ABM7NYC4_9BACT|nr:MULTISPECIES: helix-turn-helix domain-containing protein [Prevotella]MDN5552669.1 helix-turn-helix domain-containing protein [Prevotella sp.]BCS85474.1 transcriptional regulator [Prevotella herbatica]
MSSLSREITIASTLELHQSSHIDEDLLLIDSLADLPFPDEPKRMGCLLIALCTKGEARYTVDTVEYFVHPNDMLIVSPGQVANNYLLSPDCDGIGILASDKFFREIISNIHELSSLFLFSKNNPVCGLHNDESEMLQKYYRLLKEKVDLQDHHFRVETVKSLLQTVIYDISNTIYRIQNNDSRKRTRGENIFFDYINLVEHNFRNERRVSWYAKQLNITAKYLSETVKSISHRTPNEWIDYYVTLEIRVLLKNTSKSIKEISLILNFPNQSFLGKYFKEHVGMSPTQYRRS